MWSSMSIFIAILCNVMWNASEKSVKYHVNSFTIRVKPHVKCKWNSVKYHVNFYSNSCENLCEMRVKTHVQMCVKGLTSFHTIFTHISLYNISHACEICMWKTCERCVKRTHLSHIFHAFFHRVFHTHTPGSVMI